jgi:hypothetical protein
MVTKQELDCPIEDMWLRVESCQAEHNRVQMEAIRVQMAQNRQMFMKQL